MTRRGDLPSRRRGRPAAAGLAALLVTSGAAAVGWVTATPVGPAHAAAAYRPTGIGHGRGMSQFGAMEQAAAGASADHILLSYYPGATLAAVPRTPVRVRLMSDDGETLDVQSDTGLLVGGRRVVAGQAAHLTPTSGGGADVVVTIDCDGDTLWRGHTDDPWAYPLDQGNNRPAAEHLKICGGGAYRGALGVALEGDAARTINEVDVEDYLLGVVPAEMQANWADRGGTEALRAQAIAARSYALAEHRYAYAQTCDTTDCQEYPGTEREDDRAAAAVRSTAGQVLLRTGRILRTEYSSSPDGGQPIDITTLDLGPAPQQLGAVPHPNIAPIPRPQTVIDVKYAETGGNTGPLGAPDGPELPLPAGLGTYRQFHNGVIVATAALGVQVIDLRALNALLHPVPRPADHPQPDEPPTTAATPTPPPTPMASGPVAASNSTPSPAAPGASTPSVAATAATGGGGAGEAPSRRQDAIGPDIGADATRSRGGNSADSMPGRSGRQGPTAADAGAAGRVGN
ncbi:SpoIID/LytB domain-containing protein [Nocardia sp. BMG111209]|uniref:SpoIID/LytB domain-containing protein n=1 Tax=Nocardia sp. BMG111209 TaxID=1160137 RepID=UPI00039BEB1A|nr:SpoIID/LytB domain-containing protein [Nocardia sp. BMG111209]